MAGIDIYITGEGITVGTPRVAARMEGDYGCVRKPRSELPRGMSIIALPDDYTVVDLETTGLSPYYDEILELAAIRVRGNEIVETYQQLVKPQCRISAFITSLTHITEEMVKDAPRIWDVLPGFLDFVGKDILVGHNISFDARFLHCNVGNYLNRPFENDYVNTVRIARKGLPGLPNYKLDELCTILEIDASNHHRALADCEQTNQLYQTLKGRFKTPEDLTGLFAQRQRERNRGSYLDARLITSTIPDEEMDHDHILYGKRVVFTGKLERYARREAMQLVANFGGVNQNTLTKDTDFLVLGCNDYCPTIKDGKSSKQKKAEKYALKGFGISILDEQTFYDLVADGE